MDTEKIKDARKKLLEMNKIVTELDSIIKPKALEILFPFFFEKTPPPPHTKSHTRKGTKAEAEMDFSDVEAFFNNFSHEKPADNVLLISAWLYSQYGVYSMTAKEIKDYGSKTGLTISNRPDNTLRQAKRDGKALFRQSGNGWEPTLLGEKYLKNTYKVVKGKNPRPTEGENQ